ncbi:MAG: phosphatase PAP2 family protein [Myxococcaceae bacterium]|nr:phosphatase PAP2 family protein [Myxococcaceae bacterium]MCI0671700.1 phosphatase PAP2 family protein [Myxococcaceae bacterium]
MKRADAPVSRAVVGGAVSGLPHRWSNLVIAVTAGTAALYLATAGQWAPGAAKSAGVFALFALGPVVLRVLTGCWPRSHVLRMMEAFWLLPVVTVGHGYLGPLVDAFDSRLMDRYLAQADLRLFGHAPSVTLSHVTPAWLTELLLICYYSYFLWPAALGALLWWRGRRAEFGQYVFALTLLFLANYVGYVLVPAVGPRFYLASAFPAPLEGMALAPVLDGVMRLPPFLRDCFPSGHTGVTLTVLAFAWRFERVFFRWMLLPASGLILGTLVGRFHYGVDLLCALPLVLAILGLATAVVRLEPAPGQVSGHRHVPALARREQPA